MTLRPVGDAATRDFMQAFYKHWLDQETSDPTAALRATQRAYIAAGQPLSTWAPFIIVGA